MRKVNLTVIRPWVVKKIIELVGFEDEVVVEYAMGLLEDDSQPVCVTHELVKVALNSCCADARSEKNANQSDRLPHKPHAHIHVCPLETTY